MLGVVKRGLKRESIVECSGWEHCVMFWRGGDDGRCKGRMRSRGGIYFVCLSCIRIAWDLVGVACI